MIESKSKIQVDSPRVGSRCRVWCGPGFTRSGHVLEVNPQDQDVLVCFDYDIPNEWVSWDQLC